MGDFDPGRRWGRTVLVLLSLVAVAVVAAAGGVWLGRSTAAAARERAPAAAGLTMAPPWTAGTPAGASPRVSAAAGTVDAGQGWAVPDPGAAGPFSVTDQGVPFGYRQDRDGAALAAVNAVVAARYLATTFTDPWAALGFLADPQYAARGGNPTLESFFTGPVVPGIVGDDAAVTAGAPPPPAPPAGGGRVLGVRVTPAATPTGAMRAVVLWESFSREYRPDGQQGYTVRIDPVSVLLVWADGDWKVSDVGRPAPGTGSTGPGTTGPGTSGVDAVVVGVVPDSFPVPAEGWHR